MQPTIGGIMMVLGMFAVIAQPVLGVGLIGGGYWLYNRSNASQRGNAAGTFFGIGVLAMIALAVAALFS